MADDFSLERSARLAAVYADYRSALDASDVEKRFMPYRWWTLPNPISGMWMVYSSMLEDYATDLANIINDLTHHVSRLRAWAAVVVIEQLRAAQDDVTVRINSPGGDVAEGIAIFNALKPHKPALGLPPRPVAPSSRISPPAPVEAPGNGAIAVG